MLNIFTFVRTLSFLRLKQIIYQLKNRLIKQDYILLSCPKLNKDWSLDMPISKTNCLDQKGFSFINIKSPFTKWDDTRNGMLWAYNLNYMDWLNQEDITEDEIAFWIDSFIDNLEDNKVGLDPYPIALRSINWIKAMIKYPNLATPKRLDSLYSQYIHLSQRLEFHLLGNHLLEDAYALFFGSIFFADRANFDKASKLLQQELEEQVLPDGAHYEQSPMYHCILLDRLLDCYNISLNNLVLEGQGRMNTYLYAVAQKMLGHLQAIIYEDGSFPLVNDSALGIAPTAQELFDYARRLFIDWELIALGDSGYRKLQSKSLQVLLDVGNVMASYQAGHTHADTFNYELRIGNKPFIVDTGISTYNKTSRRQYERSTIAHNTVSIESKDSSEVWGGFRLGKRAKVAINIDEANHIQASHNGFGRNLLHKRDCSIVLDSLVITDSIVSPTNASSYIHLAPNVKILEFSKDYIRTNLATISIKGAKSVAVFDEQISERYNEFLEIKVVKIDFTQSLSCQIKPLDLVSQTN